MWIKATLKAKGYKLKDMAEALDITASRVTDVLRGVREVQSDELAPLAKLLGLNLKSILASLDAGALTKIEDSDTRLKIQGRLMGDGTLLPLAASDQLTHVAMPPDAKTSEGLYCFIMGDNSMAQEIKAGDIVIAADPRIHFYPMVPGALFLVRCKGADIKGDLPQDGGRSKFALRQFMTSTPSGIDHAASGAGGSYQGADHANPAKPSHEGAQKPNQGTDQVDADQYGANQHGTNQSAEQTAQSQRAATSENWLVALPNHPDPKLASWRFDMLPADLTGQATTLDEQSKAAPNESSFTIDMDREILAGETVHTDRILAAVLWVHRRYKPAENA